MSAMTDFWAIYTNHVFPRIEWALANQKTDPAVASGRILAGIARGRVQAGVAD
jgi:hypothetical protein